VSPEIEPPMVKLPDELPPPPPPLLLPDFKPLQAAARNANRAIPANENFFELGFIVNSAPFASSPHGNLENFAPGNNSLSEGSH
jgi:hypothetical protein